MSTDEVVFFHKDEDKKHYCWEQGPEDDRTVSVRMGRVRFDLFREDAEALYQMLGKWRDQTPGRGWNDDPLQIRERG